MKKLLHLRHILDVGDTALTKMRRGLRVHEPCTWDTVNFSGRNLILINVSGMKPIAKIQRTMAFTWCDSKWHGNKCDSRHRILCFLWQGHALRFITASMQIIFAEIFQRAKFRNKIEKQQYSFAYICTYNAHSSLEIRILTSYFKKM